MKPQPKPQPEKKENTLKKQVCVLDVESRSGNVLHTYKIYTKHVRMYTTDTMANLKYGWTKIDVESSSVRR